MSNLNVLKTADGISVKEVQLQNSQRKSSISHIKNILSNTTLKIEVRKHVLMSYIKLILLYGSKSWKISRY